MTRKEFISKLQETLSGEVSNHIITENVNYYDAYIKEQIETGHSEEEVLDTLGDPRLIAKTIIDTNGGEGEYDPEPEVKSNFPSGNNREQEDEQPDPGFWIHSFDTTKWYVKVIAVLIPILILIVIVLVALGLLKIVMWLAWPIVIVAICYFVYRLFKR